MLQAQFVLVMRQMNSTDYSFYDTNLKTKFSYTIYFPIPFILNSKPIYLNYETEFNIL